MPPAPHLEGISLLPFEKSTTSCQSSVLYTAYLRVPRRDAGAGDSSGADSVELTGNNVSPDHQAAGPGTKHRVGWLGAPRVTRKLTDL